MAYSHRNNTVVEDLQEDNAPPAKNLQVAIVLLPFARALKSPQSSHEPSLWGYQSISTSPASFISLPYSIIYPVSPVERELLDVSEESSCNLPSVILSLVLSGRLIWEDVSRAVIRVGENIVVKVAQCIDEDEHAVLQFLEEQVPGLPASRALSLVKLGSTSFMFVTLIPGATLESRWPSLSAVAKANLRRDLDKSLCLLRQCELPPDMPLGSSVGRHLCKDVRS